ncbi:hypothetical protein LCGC14_1276690, partial [marine sediment metagenome]
DAGFALGSFILKEPLTIKEIYDKYKALGWDCMVTLSKGIARVNYVKRDICQMQ